MTQRARRWPLALIAAWPRRPSSSRCRHRQRFQPYTAITMLVDEEAYGALTMGVADPEDVSAARRWPPGR
jgi:hypothetical protein